MDIAMMIWVLKGLDGRIAIVTPATPGNRRARTAASTPTMSWRL